MKVKLHPLIVDPVEFRVGEEILNLIPGQEVEVGEPSAELQHHLDTNGIFVGGEHPTYVPLLVVATEEAKKPEPVLSPVPANAYVAQVHQPEKVVSVQSQLVDPADADEPTV